MAVSNNIKNEIHRYGVVLYRSILRNRDILLDRPPKLGDSTTSRSTSELSEAEALDISSRVTNLSFTKTMDSPMGTFSLTLANNTGLANNDWTSVIEPGDWICIYATNSGEFPRSTIIGPPTNRYPNRNIRGVCYVQRTAVQTQVNPEKGDVTVVVEVSGHDFGVIYQETNIFHNLFMFEATTLQAASGNLPVIGNTPVNEQMRIVHQLFYSPQDLLPMDTDSEGSLTSIAKQWLLPRRMIMDLGLALPRGEPSYWGNIQGTLNFSPSRMNVPVNNPIDFLSGVAWSKMKELSIPQFHELFTETDDRGCPQLIYRPIPWQVDGSGYPNLRNSISRFIDLPSVTVPAIDIFTTDLGRDNGNRYNYYFIAIKTALYKAEDNIAALMNSPFPYENRDDVRSNGFRIMHVDINSLTLNTSLADGKTNRNLLLEYCQVIYDYWSRAHLLESGSITKIGSNDIKLGKTLLFDSDVPYHGNKLFYIEGYTDSFTVDPSTGSTNWTQTVQLTRGSDINDYRGRGRFGRRDTPNEISGEFTPAP